MQIKLDEDQVTILENLLAEVRKKVGVKNNHELQASKIALEWLTAELVRRAAGYDAMKDRCEKLSRALKSVDTSAPSASVHLAEKKKTAKKNQKAKQQRLLKSLRESRKANKEKLAKDTAVK